MIGPDPLHRPEREPPPMQSYPTGWQWSDLLGLIWLVGVCMATAAIVVRCTM